MQSEENSHKLGFCGAHQNWQNVSTLGQKAIKSAALAHLAYRSGLIKIHIWIIAGGLEKKTYKSQRTKGRLIPH